MELRHHPAHPKTVAVIIACILTGLLLPLVLTAAPDGCPSRPPATSHPAPLFLWEVHHAGRIEASRTLPRPDEAVSPPRESWLLGQKTKPLSANCSALQHT